MPYKTADNCWPVIFPPKPRQQKRNSSSVLVLVELITQLPPTGAEDQLSSLGGDEVAKLFGLVVLPSESLIDSATGT